MSEAMETRTEGAKAAKESKLKVPKKAKKVSEPAAARPLIERQQGKIRGRIIDYRTGLREVDNVKAVRVHSKGYTLLIMQDFTPMLGKLEGDVCLVTADEEIEIKNVIGYYKHQDNLFTLVVDAVKEPENTGENDGNL